MRRRAVALVVAALLAYGLGACSGTDERASRTLNVYAAASLGTTFTELAERFEEEHDGVVVELTLAGSTDLVAQVDQGAPADVLATADEASMARVDTDLLAAAPEVFATNTLTLVVPPDNPAQVTGLADLAAGSGTRLVVCAPEVPCGAAAVAVADAADVELAPVSEEQSVTDVLGKVRAGEADAGLVYVTDAVGAGDDVRVVDVPQASQVVNRYPIAPLVDAADDDPEQGDLAAAFVDLVRGGQGGEVLAAAGFGRP